MSAPKHEGPVTYEEQERRRRLFIHARERDRQAWLVTGLNISLEEYYRRYRIVVEAAAKDTIRL